MHPDDPKLSKALQKHLAPSSSQKKPGSPLAVELLRIPDRELTSRVEIILENRLPEVAASASATPADARVREAYTYLLSAGLPATVSTLLQDDSSTLSTLEIADLPLIASAESTLTRWIDLKTGKDLAAGTALASEVISIALKDPAEAIRTSLGTWCCKSIDSNQLKKLSPLVAADQAQGNRHWLLDTVLLRDKSADFLISWIREDLNRLDPTAERFRLNPKLLKLAMDSAQEWLMHSHADSLVAFYTEIFREFPASREKARAVQSGRLLTLAGCLLPIADSHPAAASLLQELQSLSLRVWKSSIESTDRHRTWAFIQSGNLTLSGSESAGLTPDQAKMLCLAIMRARKGKDALIELESATVNLGGVRFGSEGEPAIFDATLHNDLNGGLLPGDPVTIVRPGILLDDNRLVKADVLERTIQ